MHDGIDGLVRQVGEHLSEVTGAELPCLAACARTVLRLPRPGCGPCWQCELAPRLASEPITPLASSPSTWRAFSGPPGVTVGLDEDGRAWASCGVGPTALALDALGLWRLVDPYQS